METGHPTTNALLYKNDLHKPRSSCQKKKEFVRFEYSSPLPWPRGKPRKSSRSNRAERNSPRPLRQIG